MSLKTCDYAVVVAHPDDEIIFASSLIENASIVVVCFGPDNYSELITRGRIAAIDELPHNFLFLYIPESGIKSCVGMPTLPCHLNAIGLITDNNNYYRNYSLISDALDPILRDVDAVFTHSPWGDYGHFEHIQIFKCVEKISRKYNHTIYCFGYVSQFSVFNFLFFRRRQLANVLVANTDLKIYDHISRVYKQHNCWTWCNNYVPSFQEFFYLHYGESKTFPFAYNDNKYHVNFLALTFLHKFKVSTSHLIASHNNVVFCLKVLLYSLFFLSLSAFFSMKQTLNRLL